MREREREARCSSASPPRTGQPCSPRNRRSHLVDHPATNVRHIAAVVLDTRRLHQSTFSTSPTSHVASRKTTDTELDTGERLSQYAQCAFWAFTLADPYGSGRRRGTDPPHVLLSSLLMNTSSTSTVNVARMRVTTRRPARHTVLLVRTPLFRLQACKPPLRRVGTDCGAPACWPLILNSTLHHRLPRQRELSLS